MIHVHGVRAVVGLLVVALTVQGTRVAEEEATELPGRSVLPMATELPSGGESLTVLFEALSSATPELAEVLGGQQAFTVFAPTDQVGASSLLLSREWARMSMGVRR